MKTDSVAGSGSVIILARVVGMGLSFVLFMLLAQKSEMDAGLFRTALTYLMFSEFFGLMGTHRWFAIELTPGGPRRWSLFVAGIVLAGVSALLIGVVQAGISWFGVYGPHLSRAVLLVALATLPSALLNHVQTCLVGVGQGKRMGYLNLVESAGRSMIGIGLVFAGHGALDILVVYISFRWLVALAGLVVVLVALLPERRGGVSDFAVLSEAFGRIPQFAMIMLSFLIMRNASILMLPALTSTAEAAHFAVPFQLVDLGLLVPTILALSSNYLFNHQAGRSRSGLRWVLLQLWTLTSVYVVPLVMLSLVFGENLLACVFGAAYRTSAIALSALALSMPLIALDQVLSQTLQASKRYREDRNCVMFGASIAVVATFLLAREFAATGAAFAVLLTSLLLVVMRLRSLGKLIAPGLLLHIVWRPTRVALLVALPMLLAQWLADRALAPAIAQWAWLPASLLALPLYAVLLRRTGAVRRGKVARVRKFLKVRQAPAGSVAEAA